MKSEKPGNQSELVGSLASAIHKKMVAPASDRAKLVNGEIQQINHRLAALEKESARLESRGRATRFLAFSLAGCAVLLSLVLFYLISWPK